MEKDYLILKRASVSRPSGQWNDDDFDVLADRIVVGLIFQAKAAPVGSPWMWTLLFGPHEDRTFIGPKIAQPALVGVFFGTELLLDEDADRPPPMLGERLTAALTNLLTDAAGPLRVFVTPPMLHAPLGFAGI